MPEAEREAVPAGGACNPKTAGDLGTVRRAAMPVKHGTRSKKCRGGAPGGARPAFGARDASLGVPACPVGHANAYSERSRPLIPIEAGHPVEGGRCALVFGDRIAGPDPLCSHAWGGPMPAERAPMRKVREVLRLKHALGASERQIAVSVGVSRSTIGEYLRRAAVIGINWPVPAGMDDAELERRLFTPAADGHPERRQPDWNQVHKELKRRGVTLVLLWEEYRAEHGEGYGYSRFCDLYRGWRRTISPTMRQTHGPAEK